MSHCNFDIVSLLLDTGAIDLNKQNKAGYTATMLATLAYPQTDRQQDVIQKLFSMGDVNAKASKVFFIIILSGLAFHKSLSIFINYIICSILFVESQTERFSYSNFVHTCICV